MCQIFGPACMTWTEKNSVSPYPVRTVIHAHLKAETIVNHAGVDEYFPLTAAADTAADIWLNWLNRNVYLCNLFTG